MEKMRKPVETIKLNNFKGAAGSLQIDFDKDKPIILIFGENGTGKSTIIDALDFVSNERFGSILDRSVGKNIADYMPTLGTSRTLLEVTVTNADGTWTGKIGTRAIPSISGPASNRPKVEILRRNRILSIVNAQPKERYNAIKDFVEVPACESNEKNLRDAEKQKKREYEDSVKAVYEAEATLKSLWETEGKPEASAIDWAKRAISIDHSQLDTQIQGLESISLGLAGCATAQQGITSAKNEFDTATKEFNKSVDAFDLAKNKMKKDVDALIDVLTKAQTYLQKDITVTACPVCEQTIDGASLLSSIQHRLSEMNDVVAAQKKVQTTKGSVESKETILLTKQKDFRNAVISLKNKAQSSNIELVQKLKIDYLIYSKLIDASLEIDEESIVQAESLYNILDAIRGQLASLKQNLNDVKGKHSALKNHVETIQNKTVIAKKLEKLVIALTLVLTVVENERKNFVDNLLSSIAGDIEAMYTAVHPSEGIGKIRWYLNPSFQGSLEFEGQFQGTDNVPPPAYYSESHLDTLGVCVFLALTKYNMSDTTVVVLDDVVTSVDQAHMERFFRMLNEQATNFNQIIIGTHYRPWRDKYRYYSGASSNVQLIELQNWSILKGIRHAKTKFSVEELSDALSAIPFDRQVVASKAGILLEGILDRLGRQYQCKMPMKNDPDYTLGEFIGGFSSALKKLMKIERQKPDKTIEIIELVKKLEACTEQSWVRNQVGCHFSTAGMTIAETEVADFAKKVIDLTSSVICVDCGEIAYKNKSGSYWECRCGRTKLFPLVTP